MRRRAKWLLVCLVFAATTSPVFSQSPGQGRQPFPQIWTAQNGSWDSREITTEPQVVVSIAIRKAAASSLLKIAFSGGNLSSWAIDDLMPQAVVSIAVDGVTVADALDLTSTPTFQNRYPSVSTVLTGLRAGVHTISVVMSKVTDDGYLTYMTTAGHTPNTYRATLTVEDWPSAQ